MRIESRVEGDPWPMQQIQNKIRVLAAPFRRSGLGNDPASLKQMGIRQASDLDTVSDRRGPSNTAALANMKI